MDGRPPETPPPGPSSLAVTPLGTRPSESPISALELDAVPSEYSPYTVFTDTPNEMREKIKKTIKSQEETKE